MEQGRQINRKNILVVGDVMLDQYYYGSVSRISPEAPVPVLRKDTEKCVLGGAAHVAANLAAGGQHAFVMSVVGKDEAGDILLDLLAQAEIDAGLTLRQSRATTVKTRFVADGHQQLLRMDTESTGEMPDSVTGRLLAEYKSIVPAMDIIILSDYQKGLLTYDFVQGIIKTAGQMGKKVLIDVKDPDVSKYHGAYLLKPNLKELRMLTDIEAHTDDEIADASRQLMQRAGCTYVLTTCGARGMVLVGEDLRYSVNPARQEVYDVTGAGDTVIAYLAACLANGFGIQDAVLIANHAAGIQVAKAGTASVSLKEVIAAMGPGYPNADAAISRKAGRASCPKKLKLLSKMEAVGLRQQYADKKIVFTNGCFDILHAGHIRCLQEAAKLGDILVVGLNADASVTRLKGNGRPVNSQADRAEILCALECVDYVAVFAEDTPEELIKGIQPDVLVKGGDYTPQEVVGAEIVRARGGMVRILPFTEGRSTTGMIEKMTGAGAAKKQNRLAGRDRSGSGREEKYKI